MSLVRTHWQYALVGAVVLVLAIGWYGGRSNDPDPDDLATSIGATYCDKTTFVITSRLDGDNDTLYDCLMGDKHICVTEDGGIARDVTDSVIALFEDTFETSKPTCVQ